MNNKDNFGNFEKLKKGFVLKYIENSYGPVLLPHSYGKLNIFKAYLNIKLIIKVTI